MEKTEQLQGNMDRGLYLEQRIIALKQESRDVTFTAYLDRLWNDVKQAEHSLERIEQELENNYAAYIQRFPVQQSQSAPQAQPMSQPQPAFQTQAQPVSQPQAQMAPQPVRPYHREMNVRYEQQAQFARPVQPVPQPQTMPIPPAGEWKLPPTRQQPMGTAIPLTQPEPQGSHKSVEFKVGTVIFGVVGIAFLLVAFITFGLNYMSNVMQGIFLYCIGIVILASSELFFSKWVEKFSYCLTGLGISSLYATTMINYIYLSIFPGWAALLVTVVITAFFFFLSRKKDSGMIRIICLIGCYISLVPIHQLKSMIDFVLPALVLFFVNVAGIYCPVKKRRKAVDAVQLICSCIVLFYLIYLQWVSGMVMWPVYILVCGNILALHLLYLTAGEEEGLYRVLYFVGQSVYLFCLLYIGFHEMWLNYGVLGMALLGIIMSLLFRKRAIRLAPYMFVALYCIFAYAMEEDAFWFSIACLVIFAVNKGLVRRCKEMPMPDAVYTMVSAIGVCLFMRGEEVQFVSYIYAAAILLSCIIVKRFRSYHIYTSLTFGWLFLLTEDWKPFLCSILIAVLASSAIGAGFYKKDKGIRVYGLVLMICVALKLVIFDFYQSSAGTRILVFFVVGILILGISFVYIFLEKKQMEKEQQNNMPPSNLNLYQ